MSDTPRTDAVCMAHPVRPECYTKRQWNRDQAIINHARELERELARLQQKYGELCDQIANSIKE